MIFVTEEALRKAQKSKSESDIQKSHPKDNEPKFFKKAASEVNIKNYGSIEMKPLLTKVNK